MAARLSEDPERSVLLLEAGPDYPEFQSLPDDLKWGGNLLMTAYGPHDWGYVGKGTAEQSEPIPVPRGKATGGTSAINAQTILRGVPEDYDGWASWGNDEWAFTKVLPYFRKLETDLEFRGDFHGTDGPLPIRRLSRGQMAPHARALVDACLAQGFPSTPDHNHPDAAGIGPKPMNNRDGVRMSTALTYLDPARHRLNFTIKGNVTVTRILFQGNRAVGVEAESGGERFSVQGDQIVLSAGALASPHLLLLSGVGPAEHLTSVGVDVVHELPGVGQNLRDHPYVLVLFQEKGEAPNYSREPCVNVVLRFTAEGSEDRNDLQVGHMPLDSSYMPDEVPIPKGAACFCLFGALMLARSSGELKLASRDPHVQPSLDYRYFSDRWDLERMRQAVRLAVRLSEHPSFNGVIAKRVSLTEEELATDAALDAWILRNVGQGYHSSGTCKMGPALDSMAVVDQYCRVHGLEGLRVVDASVMPDVIRANTNTTTIMIAEKVADWIKQGK